VTDEAQRVAGVATWYTDSQLEVDKAIIRHRFKAISSHFVGQNCLELGPADGVMTSLLLSRFQRLTVVDGARHLLDQIPEQPNLSKVHALFEEFEPPERFDTVVIDHVLEHVEDPSGILRRVAGWVRDRGHLIIGVPNANSVHRLAAVKMGLLSHPAELNERDSAVGHRRVFDLVTLQETVRGAGFSVLATGGVFLKPLSNAQIQETWDTRMIDAFAELGMELPEIAAEIFVVCTPG
jgi:2-polyprenyl-3-methyl-5-hydroxy-6-metoxy-1,4-benzoquinol methylase